MSAEQLAAAEKAIPLNEYGYPLSKDEIERNTLKELRSFYKRSVAPVSTDILDSNKNVFLTQSVTGSPKSMNK